MPIGNDPQFPASGFSIAIIAALNPALVLPGEIFQYMLRPTTGRPQKSCTSIFPTTMTPDDTRQLHEFLTIAEAERLGEGDLIAGANTLAAMAISLANIQRPGSGLVDHVGRRISVGTSLVISGSLSSSLVSERVLTGLAACQSNLASRLNRLNDTTRPSGLREDPADEMDDRIFQQLCQSLTPPANITGREADSLSGRILQTSLPVEFRDLSKRPMIFTTASTPARLAGQLERSHLGRPFVHLGVAGQADLERFGSEFLALMEGRLTLPDGDEVIGGTIVVTDRNGALDEAVQGGSPAAKWASNLLWLVDGKAGPELGDFNESKNAIPIDGIEGACTAAMGVAWGRRINGSSDGPVTLDVEFAEAQARWIDFLKSNEEDFPGIAGALRNLYATLVFGFHRMFNAAHVPAGFTWHHGQVGAFAMFLVHRMVNARAVMMRSAEIAKMRQLEMAILGRLVDGPRDQRDIARSFHRLRPGQCLDALRGLQAAGRVVCGEEGWALARPYERADSNAWDLVLES